MTNTDEIRKKQNLRNNEYYNLQSKFDELYKRSKNNNKFSNLINLVTNKDNIKLAFRNIKTNSGSKTCGTDKKNIDDIKEERLTEYIEFIQRRFKNFKSQEIRRVMIPKNNTGKLRPLGIPTISDRIVQQCIKQVLEPICEAKFHKHSYGFRPNRSTENAISRMVTLINKANFQYCVDIDIKGFFDNINHNKLLKQLWSMGIRDKNFICIIKKILTTPVEGEGIQNKGTPQGGILSPLLSNIVLNELDWWISSQWETFETKHKYTHSNKYKVMKESNLKEIFIIRYADDFKIMCRTRQDAENVFKAVKMWLKERLKLEISKEKSKIINLNKKYSEFLGFKIKNKVKGKKKVALSHISDKAKNKILSQIKEQIIKIKKKPSIKNLNKYNSMILGIHNYYKIATHINLDFNEIGHKLSKTLFNRLRMLSTNNINKTETFNKFYGTYNYKLYTINKITLFPISGIKNKNPMNFSQDICNYTKIGREKIHTKLKNINITTLRYLMENPIKGETTEYNDNRISLYSGQGGLCRITKLPLKINYMESHHIIPRKLKGDDSYKNLVFVHSYVHKMIHCTNKDKYEKYFNKLKIIYGNIEKEEELEKIYKSWTEKIDKFRIKAENFILV